MLGALCSVLGAGALCWVLGASTTADAVVEAAREYLKQYQVDLTFVVAEERSVQRLLRQVPPVPDAVTRRQMTSEVHFRFVAGDGQWMPIRDVKVVDGKDVPPRGDLSDALASPNVAQVVRAFKAFNSQFNIGRLSRNFNEPTLALSVLDPGRAEAFRFDRKGSRTDRGRTLVTVGFREERGKASLVYDLRMQPAPVDGELVIEAGTGRIHSTLLRVRLGAVRAELTTTYEHDERLDILVPARFRESYEDGTERATDVSIVSQEHHERIFVESTYTNYRRFAATARIK